MTAAKKPAKGKKPSPIVKSGSGYKLKGLNTGKTLGTHKTKAGALNQLRAVEASMHGRSKGK